MSAPVAADVLRELGAEVICFSSLKRAVRWFDAYAARQVRTTKDLAGVGSPVSRVDLERDRATYAALLACFSRRVRHAVDQEDLSNSRLLGFALDYVCGSHSLRYLADEAGLSQQGFSRWMERGEAALQRRLEARGLLPSERCACGCGVRQAA